MKMHERNFDHRFDEEGRSAGKSHDLAENDYSRESECFSDTSSCALISPPSSFSGGLRRSTFDLSSVGTFVRSHSDRSDYNLHSTFKMPTLRYRGRRSSSSSSGPQECLTSYLQEGAATKALLELSRTANISKDLGEIEDSIYNAQPLKKMPVMEDTAPAPNPDSENIHEHNESMIEQMLFGFLVLPLLHFTIRIERYARRLLSHLLNTSSPSSCQRELIDFDNQEIRSSLMQSSIQRDDFMYENEDACSSSLSSHSCEEDNIRDETDEWGHFTDFPDDLADESTFIPSCHACPVRPRPVVIPTMPPSTFANTMATLTESTEEEECTEDWSF